MLDIRLYDRAWKYITSMQIMGVANLPEAILWGQRVFLQGPHAIIDYREVDSVYVFPPEVK